MGASTGGPSAFTIAFLGGVESLSAVVSDGMIGKPPPFQLAATVAGRDQLQPRLIGSLPATPTPSCAPRPILRAGATSPVAGMA